MSLETLALGSLALRGLSLLTRTIQGLRQPELTERLASGEPLSEAEFQSLMDDILAAIDGGEEIGGDGALSGLSEEIEPLLFAALDRDGSGEIAGEELRSLQRVVAQIHSALPPESAGRVLEAYRMAT